MNKNKLLIAKIQENGKTNGDVPTNLTAWIKRDLEDDEFVPEDEEVLSAQMTKYLEITNQDDYAPSDPQPHYGNGGFSNVYISAGQH